MKTRPIAPAARPRAGITLTEILISIFIMGIGMLSLATLFPLGLTYLRDAARSTRSTMLLSSAMGEIASGELFQDKGSFHRNTRIGIYPSGFDPFTQDPASAAGIGTGLNRLGGVGESFPVCYDPLWWYQVSATDNTILPTLTDGAEFRFGSGIGSLRDDGSNPPVISTSSTSASAPSAHGLPRLTNFYLFNTLADPGPPFIPATYRTDPAPMFASADDLVMQTDGSRFSVYQPNGTITPGTGGASPLVPDLGTQSRMYDYSYTWMFTGQQTDSTKGTTLDGDIVIFHNRPFAIEQRGGVNGAAGERVVEAIWGYGSAPVLGTSYGLNNRSVLLRWSAGQPDPDVRVGGYIADVTYERRSGIESSRFYTGLTPVGAYPAQRCFWYRVAKKTDVTSDHELAGFREMVVTIEGDLQAKTPISAGGSAVHVNAALVSPYVVRVVPTGTFNILP